ncbi:sigma 54-interacting transcriptional regulator [Methylibium sp.]|uniref:sigma 54-interacting transcriptional regulator n=1 Tax=Methylibium sp. TaxID=2067992 RepID=UPI003D133905
MTPLLPANAADLLHKGHFVSLGGSSAEELTPTHRELANWLTFDPDDGRIWLDDERMVMLNHQTLGSLRSELIQCVGVERARGALTRSGYIAGMRDARFVTSHWPKDHPAANLIAGTRLFGLQGLARVETVHFEYDAERISFSGEFFWHHSLEDDEHINAFGVGTDAGCWMPIGYANGYVSTLLGTPIIFREIECRSTGAAICRVIGKAAKDWDNVEEDLRYLHAEGFVGERPSTGPSLREGRHDEVHGEARDAGPRMVGVSSAFNAACHMLRKVATTSATVLFFGESGVGKELFAKMLHEISLRSKAPFVSVNCAAIPETLIESELFGVERGAFTGASVSRQGRFERSSGGTLFLDEVSSLSMVAQSKLLRALQESEIERVGGVRPIKLDLRVVAACNVDLRDEVRRGRFREDLFFRLNVYPIHLPPLRARSEDVPLLMTHFLKLYSARYGRQIHGFTQRALRAMLTYSFPGNVRELQNMVERAVIAASDECQIDTVHLFRDELFNAKSTFAVGDQGRLAGPPDTETPAARPGPMSDGSLLDRILELRGKVRATGEPGAWLDELEAQFIDEAVQRCNGNMAAAARLVGMTRTQVVYRMRKAASKS